MEIKIPGVRKLRERSERGNPLSAATKRPHLTIIMNNLLKALSQHASQSVMRTKFGWSSREWITDTSMSVATRCLLLGRDTRVSIKFLSREYPARCERCNTS